MLVRKLSQEEDGRPTHKTQVRCTRSRVRMLQCIVQTDICLTAPFACLKVMESVGLRIGDRIRFGTRFRIGVLYPVTLCKGVHPKSYVV